MSEADIEKSEMSSDISDESDYLALSTNIGAGHDNGDGDLPGDDNQDDIEDSGGDYEKSSTLEVKEAVKLNLSGVFFVFYFDKYNNSIIRRKGHQRLSKSRRYWKELSFKERSQKHEKIFNIILLVSCNFFRVRSHCDRHINRK